MDLEPLLNLLDQHPHPAECKSLSVMVKSLPKGPVKSVAHQSLKMAKTYAGGAKGNCILLFKCNMQFHASRIGAFTPNEVQQLRTIYRQL